MKPSISLIRALYAAAAKILNPDTPFAQSLPWYCGMGHTAKLLKKPDNSLTFDFLHTFGLTRPDFQSIWSFRGERAEVANKLRDLADKLVLQRRSKVKMNVAALLAAARQIEDNPAAYKQSGGSSPGILGIAAVKAGFPFYDSRRLGLTEIQFAKLFWFRATWDNTGKRFRPADLQPNSGAYGSVNYHAIDGLPAEERAAIAVNRLRRMALYGS